MLLRPVLCFVILSATAFGSAAQSRSLNDHVGSLFFDIIKKDTTAFSDNFPDFETMRTMILSNIRARGTAQNLSEEQIKEAEQTQRSKFTREAYRKVMSKSRAQMAEFVDKYDEKGVNWAEAKFLSFDKKLISNTFSGNSVYRVTVRFKTTDGTFAFDLNEIYLINGVYYGGDPANLRTVR